jgi:hypothetical protein
MTQIQQLGFLANNLTVNTAANTATFNNILVVGNSSVNVVVNSSSVYVSGVALGGGGTNVASQYAWTNTQSFSNTITFTGSILANIINAASHTVGTSFIANATQLTTTYPTVHTANVTVNGAIIANATSGTSGQVLTSAGAGNVYWSTASGGGSFSNGASISVANLAITGSLTANGSVGTSGQALVSTGTGVQWGALSPGYNYSSQFSGVQSLNAPSSTTWQLAGNFTIECWLYRTGTGDQSVIVQNSGANYLAFNINAGTGFNIYLNSSAPSFSPTDIVPLTNRWNHIALVRNGSTVGVYLNGVASTTTSTNSSTIGYNLPFYIGDLGTQSAGGTVGYISNLRVTSTAVYTANFTPPTSPLSAISGTLLLTCNSITPADSSTNNFQITNNGGVTTTAVQSPFTSTTVSIPTASLTSVRQQFTGTGSTTSFSVAGGYTPNAISVFVNGVLLRNGTEVTVTNGSTVVFAIAPLSGALIDVIGTVPTTYSSITPVSYSVGFAAASSQYLTSANSSAYAFGTGDFTVECWFYSLSTLNYPTLFSTSLAYATAGGFRVTGGPTNNTLQVATAGTGLIATTATFTNNVWNHVAVVRISGTTKLYLNGVLVGSASDSTNYTTTEGVIGNNTGAGSPYFFNGYISNLRVVKGVGVYTNAFTPPTSPLAAVQSAGPNVAAITGTQTSLLTCNGPTIIDGSTNAFTITNNGSAPVSTAIVPTFTNVTVNATAGSYSRVSYTATAGQTTFTANYSVNYVEVYLNGILLNGADYTATNGTTVVLGVAAALNDIVEIVANNIAVTTGVLSTGTPVSGQLASWTSATNTIQGFAPSAAGDVPFSTDGTSWSSTQKIVRGTSVATTSGTSIDFTNIPPWVKRITVMLNGVSTSGTSVPILQIGSGSVTTTGYLSYGVNTNAPNTVDGNSSTAGFLLVGSNVNNTYYGTFSVFSFSGFIYLANVVVAIRSSTINAATTTGGTVTLSGALDRVRLTTTNGTDTFDAGSVNILYE